MVEYILKLYLEREAEKYVDEFVKRMEMLLAN